jgi:D-alanyl-D-alanine carboxypeptidase
MQEQIYKRTTKKNPKQNSSAKPGHSEHQLGTTADISSPEVKYRLTKKLYYTKTHKWIRRNARKYGIYVSYHKNNSKGYAWEPWHLRYWNKKTFPNYYSD